MRGKRPRRSCDPTSDFPRHGGSSDIGRTMHLETTLSANSDVVVGLSLNHLMDLVRN
jgi:hypothetical protein